VYRRPPQGPLARWFRRWLYRLTLLVAAALGGFVVLAPYLGFEPGPELESRICLLFAHDDLVRKTAVISALGLWTTAVVFFRPRYYDYAWWETQRHAPLD
jgi:hypothetical protein